LLSNEARMVALSLPSASTTLSCFYPGSYSIVVKPSR
jgi:hypothetical protein